MLTAAIRYFEIEFPLGNPKRNNLPRDQGYELADLLVRLLKVIELLITLLESKTNGMIKHCALDISALPELTSAYLGCCDPLKLTSVYLHTDWKVRSHDYNGFDLAHGDYTMEYDQLLRLYRDQVPKLKRLRLALGTDVRNSLKATFREIEVITTEFPELEWLIVDEFMGYRPDFMELESDLNWFVDILNSTKLTHLAIMIDNISAFESFQRNNPAVSEDQALKDFECWYQRLVCLLVESCPRLQQLFIIDDWDYFHNATRDNVGVSVRRLNCDEMSQITQSCSFPEGLSG
uniref:WGS project CBMI000000000 data, contig CS3069_c003145 n=1 Tax=Fusarium clavum TaxID=2594811 RepID=A0A090MDI7_9HYPO|nr:unnamed protein product [Fusarium clavum]